MTKKRIHLIAIGGSVMHNLAIALAKKGYQVTGSDDMITEPSRSRLMQHHLLPTTEGWNVNNIHADLDVVILGMHAKADNPELLKAQKMGIPIYSYPAYIYEQSKDKLRVVIGGSHGKTTITAMIIHVLNYHGKNFDYLVGAQLDGFDTMVKLTEDAPWIIIEGDEYLASPIDQRPKFHLYKADIAVLSGIAWDHINVFPTFETYKEQFVLFLETIKPRGTLIYCNEDTELKRIVDGDLNNLIKIPYQIPDHQIESGITKLIVNKRKIPLQIFGDHNLLNLTAAKFVCTALGLQEENFYEAIQSFKGAAKRLELLGKNEHVVIFKDFAHSPSKVRATIHAVKTQYVNKKLISVLELHTFSSLNETFLTQYAGTMDEADQVIIFCNEATLSHKGAKKIDLLAMNKFFRNLELEYFSSPDNLEKYLSSLNYENKVLLLMSSGNFGNMNLLTLKDKILSKY
ncbi:MAG: Mur ligase family protein [Sphingobacteriaceae bacterium]